VLVLALARLRRRSVLAATAALKAGAGLVTLGLPDSLAPTPPPVPVEIMCRFLPSLDGRLSAASWEALGELATHADVVAIGPGLGQSPEVLELVRQVLRTAPRIVIDADALNLLAVDKKVTTRAALRVLTPHPGEAARLLGRRVDTCRKIDWSAIKHARSTMVWWS